jgi:hypothetical protein
MISQESLALWNLTWHCGAFTEFALLSSWHGTAWQRASLGVNEWLALWSRAQPSLALLDLALISQEESGNVEPQADLVLWDLALISQEESGTVEPPLALRDLALISQEEFGTVKHNLALWGMA